MLLVSFPVDVLGGLLVQILADPVEFFGRADRVECKLLHVGFDQSLLGINGENIVDQTLVTRPQRRTTAAATCKANPIHG